MVDGDVVDGDIAGDVDGDVDGDVGGGVDRDADGDVDGRGAARTGKNRKELANVTAVIDACCRSYASLHAAVPLRCVFVLAVYLGICLFICSFIVVSGLSTRRWAPPTVMTTTTTTIVLFIALRVSAQPVCRGRPSIYIVRVATDNIINSSNINGINGCGLKVQSQSKWSSRSIRQVHLGTLAFAHLRIWVFSCILHLACCILHSVFCTLELCATLAQRLHCTNGTTAARWQRQPAATNKLEVCGDPLFLFRFFTLRFSFLPWLQPSNTNLNRPARAGSPVPPTAQPTNQPTNQPTSDSPAASGDEITAVQTDGLDGLGY